MLVELILCIIILLIILSIVRFYLYQKMSSTQKRGKKQKNINLLYDDYYHHSKNKLSHKLNCSLGTFRKYFFSCPWKYELDILKLQPHKKYKILVISTLNLDLELKILSRFPQVKIISYSSNLFNTKLLQEKAKLYPNLTLAYGNPEDIYIDFKNSNYQFDRIIVRECLGNIKNRNKFFRNLKELLLKPGFIYLKTFTFTPIFDTRANQDLNLQYHKIFETQKKIIDYWNYNFSNRSYIINDLLEHYNNVNYAETNLLNLAYLYNFPDFVKIMKIYFRDMGYNFNNLNEWTAIKTIKVLVVKFF